MPFLLMNLMRCFQMVAQKCFVWHGIWCKNHKKRPTKSGIAKPKFYTLSNHTDFFFFFVSTFSCSRRIITFIFICVLNIWNNIPMIMWFSPFILLTAFCHHFLLRFLNFFGFFVFTSSGFCAQHGKREKKSEREKKRGME